MSDINPPEPGPETPEGANPPPAPYGGTPPPPPPPPYGDAGFPPPYGGFPPPPYTGGNDLVSPYSATSAIGYGWRKFTARPSTLLVPVLLLVLAVLAIYLVLTLVVFHGVLTGGGYRTDANGNVTFDSGPNFLTRLVITSLMGLVVSVVAQVILAGLVHGALEVADGRAPSMGRLFEGWDKGQALLAALLVAVLTSIGSLFCYVPGLIVGFLASYTMFFLVDRRLGAVDAIKESFRFTTSHLGETVLFYVLSIGVAILGAILCGVGLLVAIPVILVGQAYTYRRLSNQPVSAA